MYEAHKDSFDMTQSHPHLFGEDAVVDVVTVCFLRHIRWLVYFFQLRYPEDLINTTLSEVNFKDRKLALQQKPKTNLRILPFVTQYQPSVPNLKQILMKNWHLIEQQPLLSEIYKKPPLVSYKRGRSLKDILVRAKL